MKHPQSNLSDTSIGGDNGERPFHSEIVDRIRTQGNIWSLPGGQLLLPEVFGFCRGVERALEMLQEAIRQCNNKGRRIFLLGEIIHNPWVNNYFQQQGVGVLSRRETEQLDRHVTAADCTVIPAFGVPLDVRRRLDDIGCQVVDTSCGDVRHLWRWGENAVTQGYAVLIFGRALHDETVVTKSRLAAAGGKYLVVGDLSEAGQFGEMLVGRAPAQEFRERFGPETTNAESPAPFEKLALVSQTTMLYDETVAVRDVVRGAFIRRFGPGGSDERLLFHPTVCRATQERQSAALRLCRNRCDLVVVVGGFGSSNTRHLYELASRHAPTVFIESAEAIRTEAEIESLDPAASRCVVVQNWFPQRRPLRVAVLAGASCPEVVIGRVLERLAAFLS